MIQSFIRRYTSPDRPSVRVSPEAMHVLENYSWPGNVRELRHTIQWLTVLNSGGVIRLEDLPPRLVEETPESITPPVTNGSSPTTMSTTRGDRMLTLAEVENNYLRQVLDETKGNKKRAAEIMGIDRKTLSRMVDRHKIDMETIKTKS
jgi:two-component system response regulator AtoC